MKNNGMTIFLWIIAAAGLCLTILPPFLVFAKVIDFTAHSTLIALGMVLWFGARILIPSRAEEQ